MTHDPPVAEPGRPPQRLDAAHFQQLIDALAAGGRRVLGPQLRDHAIVHDELTDVGQLPQGWSDEQEAGHYRLSRRAHPAFFGFTTAAQGWKSEFLAPSHKLWSVTRLERGGMQVTPSPPAAEPRALLGVRACDLAAIRTQDRVLTGGHYVDVAYAAARADTLVVAVQCTRAGSTCFCTSMGTGPAVTDGFDLALTEVIDGNAHYFIIDAGSVAGDALLAGLPTRDATPQEADTARAGVARAAASMGRALETRGLRELLERSHDAPAWEQVATRCLTCANCTMACPTCFCTSLEDRPSLDGTQSERWRNWDSCFTTRFSYIHGGVVRTSAASRYRQWLTHKLGTWWDQFGTSGCVGCGRCITWCPVGIDLTAEVAALWAADAAREESDER